jgi:hypothetical protein
MLYTDGLQKSIDGPAPSAPPAGTLAAWSLDIDDDGVLSDDERDADGDLLANWDELRGRMTEAWWPAQHDGKAEPQESKYPDINFLDVQETAPAFDPHTDRDMDGDEIIDGLDDADHDGLTNQFELRRPDNWLVVSFGDFLTDDFTPGSNPWAYTNPFNPCKPFNSERCHAHPPFGYYDSDQVPPVGPSPPAGYPDSHPATPAG